MRVEKIAPCLCIDHKPDRVASGHDGMPELSIYTGDIPYSYWFSAFCPNCGRGSKLQSHRSAYFALLYWNDIQKAVGVRFAPILPGTGRTALKSGNGKYIRSGIRGHLTGCRKGVRDKE